MSFYKQYNSKVEKELEQNTEELNQLIENEKHIQEMSPEEIKEHKQKAQEVEIISTPHNTEHTVYDNDSQFDFMGIIVVVVAAICIAFALRTLKRFVASKKVIQKRSEELAQVYNLEYDAEVRRVKSDDAYAEVLKELSEQEKEIAELEKKLGIR